MRPASDFSPEQLIGKRVAFQENDEHHSCWHHQVGLKTGVIRKLGQSLAEKAALIGSPELVPPELVDTECEAVRVWVKADPCASFPRGCEAAVEVTCLQIIE